MRKTSVQPTEADQQVAFVRASLAAYYENPMGMLDLPPVVLETTMPGPLHDRMLRPGRAPVCPRCGETPIVVMQRRVGYALFRCRKCGHRWEKK